MLYTVICENRAKIDDIKILAVGDVTDAHLVHRVDSRDCRGAVQLPIHIPSLVPYSQNSIKLYNSKESGHAPSHALGFGLVR